MKNWKYEKGKEREGFISEGIILMGEVKLIFRMKREKRSLGEIEEWEWEWEWECEAELGRGRERESERENG